MTAEFVPVYQLWRCVVCGHWSYATRPPQAHTRYVGLDGSTQPSYFANVKRTKCGPFERYAAVPWEALQLGLVGKHIAETLSSEEAS